MTNKLFKIAYTNKDAMEARKLYKLKGLIFVVSLQGKPRKNGKVLVRICNLLARVYNCITKDIGIMDIIGSTKLVNSNKLYNDK